MSDETDETDESESGGEVRYVTLFFSNGGFIIVKRLRAYVGYTGRFVVGRGRGCFFVCFA